MTAVLPHFPYHKDPLATGVVKASDSVCRCCGLARGYIYTGPVYSREHLRDRLCPWCIADGSAATRFDASFIGDHSLAESGVAESAIEEVDLCTPGYSSWQDSIWLAHCNDACEFHGDASEEDVRQATTSTKQQWMQDYEQAEKDWEWATRGYKPGGDSAFYKFVCRHCQQVLFAWDLS
ncbi:hypothetical protein DFO61_4327 [Ectopseudomonas oleovorans]|uniref:CbrC family protein n=1 Tax=Ectopseudomonas oleovorans TaxID=301 RepID=A0A397MDY8_ECTOL|nr:CbrC family protein [Pseudomonas oleovorans]RIA19754.1 hypothetical protein DFO61_4327 [Pseudomonas oleovorans]